MLNIPYFRWQDRPSAEQPIQHLQRQLQVASKVLLCNSQFFSLLWLAQHLVKRQYWAHNISQICHRVRLCKFCGFYRCQSSHSSRSIGVRQELTRVLLIYREYWPGKTSSTCCYSDYQGSCKTSSSLCIPS